MWGDVFFVWLPSAKVKSEESEAGLGADALTNVKHLLLPITDHNPYLSEGTRQVIFFEAT